MKLKTSYILLLLMGASISTFAQRKRAAKKPVKAAVSKQVKPVVKSAAKDTVLKGATIEIVQSYKPEIKASVKRESTPLLPPVDTATANVNFNVPAQSLSFGYLAMPLRPLALSKDTAADMFRNYVKLGGGNLATLFFDAGIAALQGKNYSTTIHLHHLSQTGNLSNQQTSLSGLEADGKFNTSKHIWHAGLGILNNAYRYYAFPNVVSTILPTGTKQTFTGVNVAVGLANTKNTDRLVYSPEVRASYYTDINSANESKASLTLPFLYNIDTNLSLKIGVSGAYASLFHSVLPVTRNSNIAQLFAGLLYHKGIFRLNASLAPTIGQQNMYLLPDLKVTVGIPNTQLTVFGGWNGVLAQNTYEELTARNPYLNNLYNLQQTHSNEVFGGIQTNVGNHISVSGKVSWQQYDNMPLMVNDIAYGDMRVFGILYDKVNTLSLSGAVRYHIADVFAVGFSATYTSYNTTITKHAWHEPGMRMNADLVVRPVKPLVITVYASILDGLYALEKNSTTVTMSSALDFGSGAEYTFIPRLSAFANVNNIFNNQYERWYGYRVYGFNIFGGLRLKF